MTAVIPARWILAIMGNLGFVVIYALKVNLSVGILAMVNHTAIASHTYGDQNMSAESCDGEINAKVLHEDGPYIWNDHVQGVILASYFYGYILTQVPGGMMAEYFSAKTVFGLGVFFNGILTFFLPVAANISYVLVAILRIGMGITAGMSLPSMNVLIAKWSPMNERNKICTTIYTGMSLGTLIGLPSSGILASSLGWENMFYIQGTMSFLWCGAWLYFVHDSPETHPRISQREKKFLRKFLSKNNEGNVKLAGEKQSIPWNSIWTSKAVWAIIVVHFCSNLTWYLVLTKLPTYMRYILHFDIKTNSLLSSIPYVCLAIYSLCFATACDYILRKEKVATLKLRKLATFLGIIMPTSCLVLMTYVECDKSAAIFILSVGTMFAGSNFSGFLCNHIDIAPKYAGTLMGITNMIATLPGIFMPSVVGAMTHANQRVEVWRQLFYGMTLINVFGIIFFFIFASAEEQNWSKSKIKTTPPEKLECMNK